MDLEKMRTSSELTQVVWNYFLLKRIEEKTAINIMCYIDSQIGGGKLERQASGKVIVFPQKDEPRQREPSVWKAPEKISAELEKILEAASINTWALRYGLPEIGITAIADCEGLTIDRVKEVEGVGDKKAPKILETLTAAYGAWLFTQEGA
jgi:hypothetical protein